LHYHPHKFKEANKNMLNNLVVDTNVLEHASNPNEIRCEDSVKLIEQLSNSHYNIACDEGANFEMPCKNRSHIISEYLSRLNQSMLGFIFLAHLAKNKRISEFSKKTNKADSNRIDQCIINKSDRVFLKVANNTEHKLFISHDYRDMSIKKREYLYKHLGINIIEAKDF
jgi:hypothetical protein